MKVSDSTKNQSVQAPETKKSKNSSEAAQAEKAKSADARPASAEISTRAKEMSKAKDIAKETSDVREQKIAELKRRIQNREYTAKPFAIADKMVEEHLRDIS